MFLASDPTVANAPIYLISGDLIIWIRDIQSVVNMRAAGIPQVQLSPEEITSLQATLIAPTP
jgi:hypothetical protein